MTTAPQTPLAGAGTTSSAPAIDPRIRARSARTHRCYELAGRGQQRAPDWTLVHGLVHWGIPHAWLMRSGQVYDPVADKFFASWDYERLYVAEILRSFSHREASLMVLKYGVWGPWLIDGTRRFMPLRRGQK